MQYAEFIQTLSAEIRRKRKEMDLSQVVACKKIGLDYRHYQNIEAGKINIRIDTLLVLLQFYGISMAIFVQPTQQEEKQCN